MNYGKMVGSHLVPEKRFVHFNEVSGPNVGMVPAEELRVDPYLPGTATDPYDPAGSVAIDAGRFVSVGFCQAVGAGSNTYRAGRTEAGYTPLTLHDGRNLTPIGMSTHKIYRQETSGFMTNAGMLASDVAFRRGFVAEVPFVLAVNNAYGALDAGDFTTGYFGSTESETAISWIHRGKPVKWIADRLYVTDGAASTTHNLTAAIYPGIKPVIVFAENAGTAVSVTGATVAWNAGGYWVATVPTATRVYWTYGQAADQIAGEVMRIQSLTDILNRDDFSKWVEFAPQDYRNFPPLYRPATQKFNVTEHTNETPSTITAGRAYKTAYNPISLHHTLKIEIQGTVVDKDGVATSYSGATWYTLPGHSNQASDMKSQFQGQYHSVNWKTGLIEIAGNITVTAIRVSYYAQTNKRDGAVVWGAGLDNLTDGRYVNDPALSGRKKAGIPAHLNFADVVAAMRVIVR